MKLGILLAMMLCASAAKAEPLTDASNRYVLIGKHSESWSLCYANIVAEKFKDATYVEAEAAESAKAEVDVQCKPAPPRDWLEKEAQKSCDEAQKQNLARQRSEARQKRANSDPASEGGIEQLLPGMSVERTSDPCRYAPPTRPVGGGRCYSAAAEVKRSQVLTVTNRLGPYPTADRAADDLSADGWRTGTNPSSGKPIWFKRFGCEQAKISAIDTSVTDALYEALLPVKDDSGNVIGERRTTVNHAMKSCRRAWNVVARRNPGKLPAVNPFAQMGLRSSDRETPTATFEELQAFRAKAVELGLPSLATGALIGWEWLLRVEDIFATFMVEHYRPKDHPDMVRLVDDKTRTDGWRPLFDDMGEALHPELMAELDAIKRDRIGGLMLRRDWGTRGPWPTWPRPDEPDLTRMTTKVKDVIRAAGLRAELTFTSFRHGGYTEGGDAELTDREILAQGRKATIKTLPRYVKRTTKQTISGTQKRRASRTKSDQGSK